MTISSYLLKKLCVFKNKQVGFFLLYFFDTKNKNVELKISPLKSSNWFQIQTNLPKWPKLTNQLEQQIAYPAFYVLCFLFIDNPQNKAYLYQNHSFFASKKSGIKKKMTKNGPKNCQRTTQNPAKISQKWCGYIEIDRYIIRIFKFAP
jgi:hypothetical protein